MKSRKTSKTHKKEASSIDIMDTQEGEERQQAQEEHEVKDVITLMGDEEEEIIIPELTDDEIGLLHAGILLTKNDHPQGPLERVLTVNHKLRRSPQTFQTLQPTIHRPNPVPHGSVQEDPKSYGYGPWYISAFHDSPVAAPFLNPNLPLHDDSIAPPNVDPVHDIVSVMPGFESEPVNSGNRWLLENLQCGSMISLDTEYHANENTFKPNVKPWRNGRIRSELLASEIKCCPIRQIDLKIPPVAKSLSSVSLPRTTPIQTLRSVNTSKSSVKSMPRLDMAIEGQSITSMSASAPNIVSLEKSDTITALPPAITPPPATPTRSVKTPRKLGGIHVLNASPNCIPESLLDPVYTLRFREHDIYSEPLPFHEARGTARLQEGLQLLKSRRIATATAKPPNTGVTTPRLPPRTAAGTTRTQQPATREEQEPLPARAPAPAITETRPIPAKPRSPSADSGVGDLGDVDDATDATEWMQNIKSPDRQLRFPALPRSFNPLRPAAEPNEKWTLAKRLAPIKSWKKEVQWVHNRTLTRQAVEEILPKIQGNNCA
ncbi:hypothetical protein HDU76_013136 [Blyttiomyces sp. JEL0837]|nr:hypothetical protein HDU76_013136 [Blyttiomyces sp. JEL0837]